MGNPLRVILSAGQTADIEYAARTIEHLPAQTVIADKGYDADHFVAAIEAAGAQAVIPPRSNRLTQRSWGFGCSGTENRVRYLSLIIE